MRDIGPSYDLGSAAPQRSAAWERLLAYGWLGCLLVGVFLGLSKIGHPIVPGAAVMFLPAGVLMSVHGLLGLSGIAQIYNDPSRPRSRARLWQLAMLILGVGIAGPGLAVLTGDHVYRALAAPAITMLGLASLIQALHGRRTGWLAARSSNWGAYVGCWMFGLGWPLFLAWSLGLITLSSR